MKKKFPEFKTDAEAEAFVDTADLASSGWRSSERSSSADSGAFGAETAATHAASQQFRHEYFTMLVAPKTKPL
jgi:hypothetical protein